jgi:hypothetical protein
MTHTSNTWFDQYNKFADACDIPQGSLLGRPNFPAITLGYALVEEEWERETKAALGKYLANPSLENLVGVADGITDTIYVLCQLARALGIPLNQCWNAVQRANMAKVGADGKVKKREDGKVLKPEGWKAPEIWEVLNAARVGEEYRRGEMGAENWARHDRVDNEQYHQEQTKIEKGL